MHICKYALLQICIIANTHYCDPDSSPLSTSDSQLCLSTLNSHTENWVWDYFQSVSTMLDQPMLFVKVHSSKCREYNALLFIQGNKFVYLDFWTCWVTEHTN